ncbi:MAG: hypothetical protein FWD70_06665 [Desulfuromonadales bacterium]|nr:hypothetical protein [Desulfuromonadales bacterium]
MTKKDILKGTLALAFITGLAAGITAIVLMNSAKDDKPLSYEDMEEQLFI